MMSLSLLYIIDNNVSDVDFNLLSSRGQKSKTARLIKSVHGITLSQLLEITHSKLIVNTHRCSICNTIIAPVVYELVSINSKIYIQNFKPIFTKKALLCTGTESPIAMQCKQSRRGINPNSVKFYKLILKCTDEEAREYLHSNNKSPFYRVNHNTLEDYKKYQTRTVSWFNQYSTSSYNDYKSKLKYGHTVERYVEKYGINGIEIRNEISKKKASCNLERKIARYGAAGIDMYNDHIKKVTINKDRYIAVHGIEKWDNYVLKSPFFNKQNNKMCIDYWTSRYTDVSDAITKRNEYIKSKPVFTRDYCIQRFGNEAGKLRYQQYLDLYVKSNSHGEASAESMKNFFNKFLTYIPTDLTYYIGSNNRTEYFLVDNVLQKIKFYDFTIPELKIIIEYHGSRWHFNPSNIVPSIIDINTRCLNDKYKELLAVSHGYEYYVVFDTDDFTHKQTALAKIILGKYNEYRKRVF